MKNKEQFAFYLEEMAAEIRAFTLTKAYLDDMYPSLREAAKQFYNNEYENARIKGV
jgi:hypothetical protein